jgi:hypothetical protein
MLDAFAHQAPPGHDVVIARCVEHGQPIASLYTPGQLKPVSDVVVDHRGNATSLYAESNYFSSRTRTIGSLAEGLWKIFEAQVSLGHFSFLDNAYAEFDSRDRASIAACWTRMKARDR